MKINYKKNAVYALMAASLFIMGGMQGCSSLQTEYKRPDVPEYVFKNGTDGAAAAADEKAGKKTADRSYWEEFGDMRMTSLVEEALNSAGDYRTAVIAAEKARVNAKVAGADLIPDVNGSIGASVSKDIVHGGSSTKESSGSLKISYEADLFGRLDAAEKSSVYEANATVYDAEAARLTVAGTMVDLYIQLAAAKDELVLREANLKASVETYAIMTSRYNAGDVSLLEKTESEQDMVSEQTAVEDLKYTIVNTEHEINVLRNRVPGTPIESASSLAELAVPEAEGGISADILKNRPDVGAAEERLKSALSAKDAAKLDMYPQLTLSAGLASGSSEEIYQFFRNPIGSIAALISFPFLNWYKNSLQIDLASLDRDSAELSFVNTFYKALGEVSENLNSIQMADNDIKRGAELVRLTKQNEKLYQVQYDAGKVSFSDLLTAENNRRNAEISLVGYRKNLLNNINSAAQSMGGL